MKAIVLTLALIALTSAKAAPITFTGLCDTGVVTGCATQTPLGANTADGNFTVTVSPVGTPPFAADTVASSVVGTYFTSGGNSIGTTNADWITTKFDGGDTTATGTFNYQEAITANVTGVVTISGNWGADNCGTIAWGSSPTAVTGGTGTTLANGVGNCGTTTSTFIALTPFSFQESVVAGTTYNLDFEVGNTGSITGLLVDDLAATGGVSSTPEPSSVLLILPGLALLGGMVHRRRRVR